MNKRLSQAQAWNYWFSNWLVWSIRSRLLPEIHNHGSIFNNWDNQLEPSRIGPTHQDLMCFRSYHSFHRVHSKRLVQIIRKQTGLQGSLSSSNKTVSLWTCCMTITLTQSQNGRAGTPWMEQNFGIYKSKHHNHLNTFCDKWVIVLLNHPVVDGKLPSVSHMTSPHLTIRREQWRLHLWLNRMLRRAHGSIWSPGKPPLQLQPYPRGFRVQADTYLTCYLVEDPIDPNAGPLGWWYYCQGRSPLLFAFQALTWATSLFFLTTIATLKAQSLFFSREKRGCRVLITHLCHKCSTSNKDKCFKTGICPFKKMYKGV